MVSDKIYNKFSKVVDVLGPEAVLDSFLNHFSSEDIEDFLKSIGKDYQYLFNYLNLNDSNNEEN